MAARSKDSASRTRVAVAALPWYARTRARRLLMLASVGVICFLAGLLCGNYLEEHPQALPFVTEPVLGEARFTPRVPGEFEHQEALILSCAQLVQFHPQALVDIVAAAHRHIRVVGLAGMESEERRARELLAEAGLPSDAMEFLRLEVESMWVRDFGPVFVLDGEGGTRLADGRYLGTGQNPRDDHVPVRLAERLGLQRSSVPLTFEGGNLLSNGKGFCLSASTLVHRNREDRGYDKPTIDQLLAEHFGFTGRAFLSPLRGEPTQHIDMYAAFVAPDRVVLGEYATAEDSLNAHLLDTMARALEGQPTGAGPLKVSRIPMPPRPDGLWRTYTNVIFANGVLLVPTYPELCPELDRVALARYRELLPDWQVVGIDATTLIQRHGALHCVSVNAPRLPEFDDERAR